MTLSVATKDAIVRHKQRYPHARSAILPSLWEVQHEVGHVSVEGMRDVAGVLGLTPSEVQAVATFYSMFFQKPSGRHSILVCMNVSCGLRDADAVAAEVESVLGCASRETSADGDFTWEATVECLGACGGAPAMQIDHHFHENVSPDGVAAILDGYRTQPGAQPPAPAKDPVKGAAAAKPRTRRASVKRDDV